ncbi:MAG: HIG1 domain-containing protein [Rubrivivax sp.]|nr:HIG1 domain-containing protein [Rubrivivax sp.]MDH5340166.1 HIG1 domain-containing protein [Rubrivivax sp.]
MNLLTFAVLLALLATVYSLIGGVSSMATGRAVGHHTSEQWMMMRIGFQGLAVLLLVLALLFR